MLKPRYSLVKMFFRNPTEKQGVTKNYLRKGEEGRRMRTRENRLLLISDLNPFLWESTTQIIMKQSLNFQSETERSKPKNPIPIHIQDQLLLNWTKIQKREHSYDKLFMKIITQLYISG